MFLLISSGLILSQQGKVGQQHLIYKVIKNQLGNSGF